MIRLLHAHPYPSRSRACAALLAAARTVPGLDAVSLYDRYPDFDIDVAAEQEALARAQAVVWLHPVYWYSVPGLLKHWFDTVLARGWAYGHEGNALRGKHCLWAATAGGDDAAYAPAGMHTRPFAEFGDPIEMTARFCGMQWHAPFILLGSHAIDDAALAAGADAFRERLLQLDAPRREGGNA
jgi:glutathione-regulated potassium-efflux system ancillary protein KefF